MTKPKKRAIGAHDDPATRVAETKKLFRQIRETLVHMLETLGTTQGDTPKSIVTKMNELQAAHLKVLSAEEAFDVHYGKLDTAETPDFDAIRIEIGRQLDRIRNTTDASSVLEDTDPPAA
ncbi:hypothetical protein [Yoonia sp. SS1-5]|uniref:Uncharacterized protein n=1 Tax=Yoonia rhodophyticola TaxID=3137370 RepID=A0ABZ3JBY9_9RHOB